MVEAERVSTSKTVIGWAIPPFWRIASSQEENGLHTVQLERTSPKGWSAPQGNLVHAILSVRGQGPDFFSAVQDGTLAIPRIEELLADLEGNERSRDLALMVRLLAVALAKANHNHLLPGRAMEQLARLGLVDVD